MYRLLSCNSHGLLRAEFTRRPASQPVGYFCCCHKSVNRMARLLHAKTRRARHWRAGAAADTTRVMRAARQAAATWRHHRPRSGAGSSGERF